MHRLVGALRCGQPRGCARTVYTGWCELHARRFYMIGALASQLAHMPPAALCCLFAPAKQGKTRDVGCVQSQSSNRQRTTLLAPRPLANACLCEALGRQARGFLVFYAVLLKNNTAGLATALRGDRRPCQTPAAAAGHQQAQLDVVRQMPFLQYLQGA